MRVVNNVKELRKRSKMTQCELSERTGISRETIAQYETQRAIPSVGNAYIFANVFECGIEDIYSTR